MHTSVFSKNGFATNRNDPGTTICSRKTVLNKKTAQAHEYSLEKETCKTTAQAQQYCLEKRTYNKITRRRHNSAISKNRFAKVTAQAEHCFLETLICNKNSAGKILFSRKTELQEEQRRHNNIFSKKPAQAQQQFLG